MAIISTKADYKYTDLSNWPYSNVGSNIYPIRKTPILAFCDLAFLIEAGRSREYPGFGLTINGTAIDCPSGLREQWAAIDEKWGEPLKPIMSYYYFSVAGYTQVNLPTSLTAFDSKDAPLAEVFPSQYYVSSGFWWMQPTSGSLKHYLSTCYANMPTVKKIKYFRRDVSLLPSSSTTYSTTILQNTYTYNGEDRSTPDDHTPTQIRYKYSYSKDDITYEDSDVSKSSLLIHEYNDFQASPFYTLTSEEPAASGVTVQLLLLCRIQGSGSNASGGYNSVDKWFLYPLKQDESGTQVSNALLAFGKSLVTHESYTTHPYTAGGTETIVSDSCDITITPDSLIALLTSNVDIDYDT